MLFARETTEILRFCQKGVRLGVVHEVGSYKEEPFGQIAISGREV